MSDEGLHVKHTSELLNSCTPELLKKTKHPSSLLKNKNYTNNENIKAYNENGLHGIAVLAFRVVRYH